jgi:two-component system response regulator HydG
MTGRVLIVDDERSMCELLDADLRLRGFSTCSVTSAADALAALAANDVDVVLTDVRMPGTTGIELCRQITQQQPEEIPVVVMTAFGSLETAVAALRAGAYDFITKPVEMDLLAVSLCRAVEHHQLQQQVRRLSETVDRAAQFGDVLGDSPAMQAVYSQLIQIAATETRVLLTGESGTGKELIARWLHRKSRRTTGPFVAVNCGALPESLLESELFGHAKGAFTDARQERKGLFQQAQGGTIFLDEIGELPPPMQVKLLRALEERTVKPVGSDREIPFDARLVSATNRDLEHAVQLNEFREDLFYRINVIQIELPPLRARGTDVLLLAQHFLKGYAQTMGKSVTGISRPAAERLLGYNWPGNVRELRNVIERAVALTQHDHLVVDDLPAKICEYRARQVVIDGSDPSQLISLEELEHNYIQQVLEATGGNRSQAARILGLDRKTLYRKLKEPSPE